MTPCPSCGHVPTMQTTFCPQCGAALPRTKAPVGADVKPTPDPDVPPPQQQAPPAAAPQQTPPAAETAPASEPQASPDAPTAEPEAPPATPPAAAAAAAPAAAVAAASPSGGIYPPEDVEAGKMFAILGYVISPLWILPLIQKDNAYSLFHAKQMMVYTIVMVIMMIPATAIGMLTFGCGYVIILPLLYPWIMGIVHAAQGQYKVMPWIGKWGEDWFKGIIPDKRPGGWPPR